MVWISILRTRYSASSNVGTDVREQPVHLHSACGRRSHVPCLQLGLLFAVLMSTGQAVPLELFLIMYTCKHLF